MTTTAVKDPAPATPAPAPAAVAPAVADAPVVAVLLPNKPFFGARIVQVPFLRALRERHPDARVVLIAASDGADEFIRWRLCDEVQRVSGRAGLPGAVRRHRPQLVFNLRRKSTASCLAAAFGGTRRIGYDEGLLSRLLDERVKYDPTVYIAARYLALLEPGARAEPDRHTIPVFRGWMAERIERELKGRRATGIEPAAAAPRAVLLPGAGRPEKRWPIHRFLALGRALGQDLGERPVLVIGPRERGLLDEIPPDSGVEIREGLEPGALMRLVAAAPLVVANDCGPSHFAQLSGRRFLGLYRAGWSTVEDWFLDKENSDLVATRPGEGMDAILLETVLGKARALLAKPDYCDTLVPFSREEARRPRA